MFASVCQGEARWCSIQNAGEIALNYPPIARAARVFGVVVARVIYSPSGKVLSVEPVFGPEMLKIAARDQMSKWSLKTDALGDEPCESLVIVDFSFSNIESSPNIPNPPPPPGILRITVEAEVLILSDPEGTIGSKHRFWHFRNWFK
jgi:hypothetical protein